MLHFWMLLFLGLGFSGFAWSDASYPSRCVHAVGQASLEGVSEAFARQMALRDALKNASMQSNLSVSSTQQTENYQLTKSITRFTSLSKIQNYKITYQGKNSPGFDEIFDDEGNEIKKPKGGKHKNYYVEIDACLTENPKVCSQTLGNHYQLKLAIAQVAMNPNQSQSVSDISNLILGYQAELDRRLSLMGYRNKVMIQVGSEVLPNRSIMPNLSVDVLDPIRAKTGAQYLLLTVLRSAGRAYEGSKIWKNVQHFYNNEVAPNARHIEADWYLVDLVNHRVAYQQRGGFDVKGKVTVGRDRPFGTNAFFATDTGMVFDALLQQQVRSVYADIKCRSLETQVIDVRGKDYILFLSKDSGAQVGDILAVYHKLGRAVLYQGIDLGTDDEPTGFLKIKRIQQNFVVAQVEGKQGLINVGDLVKAW